MLGGLLQLLSGLFVFPESCPMPPPDMRLYGDRIMLRLGDANDWHAWRQLRGMSRDYLVPWEPSWPEKCLSSHFFSNLMRRQWRDWRQGKAYAFLIFLREDVAGKKPYENLVGGINLNDVQRGIAQKGTLGYWIGQPYAGRGLMTEAVNLVCDFAFETLRLNRVEASCLPENTASQKVLQHCGFEQEGFAKAYLQINGEWRDHLLWGKRDAPQ